ncbi:hypothetical protein GCM10027447_16730 [Glycomyces halotolerans]
MNIAYSRDGFELEVDDVVFFQGRERRIVRIHNGGGFIFLETPIGYQAEGVDPARVTYAAPTATATDAASETDETGADAPDVIEGS